MFVDCIVDDEADVVDIVLVGPAAVEVYGLEVDVAFVVDDAPVFGVDFVVDAAAAVAAAWEVAADVDLEVVDVDAACDIAVAADVGVVQDVDAVHAVDVESVVAEFVVVDWIPRAGRDSLVNVYKVPLQDSVFPFAAEQSPSSNPRFHPRDHPIPVGVIMINMDISINL